MTSSWACILRWCVGFRNVEFMQPLFWECVFLLLFMLSDAGLAPPYKSTSLLSYAGEGCDLFGGVLSCERVGVWVVIGLFVLAGSMLNHRTVCLQPFQMFILCRCASVFVPSSCVSYLLKGIMWLVGLLSVPVSILGLRRAFEVNYVSAHLV